MEQRPNIILLMADQLRGDCLGIAGHPDVKTPFLDALAAEGISVLNVFCISTSPQYFSLVIIPRTVASLHSSPPCRNRVRVECIPNHT